MKSEKTYSLRRYNHRNNTAWNYEAQNSSYKGKLINSPVLADFYHSCFRSNKSSFLHIFHPLHQLAKTRVSGFYCIPTICDPFSPAPKALKQNPCSFKWMED